MDKLYLVLIILVIMVYLKYYLAASNDFQIIQASITKVNPKHLFEKQPIIIDEPLVNTSSLTKTLFKYLYTFKREKNTIPSNVILQNKYKYMILSPQAHASSTVYIAHPKHSMLIKNALQKPTMTHVKPLIAIKLKKNQCMILPLHWWYKTEHDQFQVIMMDDLLTIILGKL